MKKTLTFVLCLVLLANLILVGCGGGKNESIHLTGTFVEGGLDGRMSAADTFGSLDAVTDDGMEAQGTAELDPRIEIQPLGAFYQGFADAEIAFIRNWGDALGQVDIQTTGDNILIPMDTIELAKVFFGMLAAYDQGEDAMAAKLNKQFPIGNAGWKVQVDEGGSGYLEGAVVFNIEGSLASGESWFWFGFWQEDAQYLYCSFMDEGLDTFELDALKTPYGYACQIYGSAAQTVYRLSFATDGSWDGGIGIEYRASQPAVMTGEEDLKFAAAATTDGDFYGIISGDTLEVKFGERAVERYTISVGGAGVSQPGNGSSAGTDNPGEYPSLSAAAVPYIGMWHASPVVGSGFSERFALSPDGIFVWAANEMDGASRIRYLAGNWDVEGGKLVLTCTIAVLWEGGQVQDNSDGHMGSYGSATVITNPQTVFYRIDETLTSSLSQVSYDSDRGKDVVVFGSLKCWSYGDEYEMVDSFWDILQTATAQAQGPSARK